MEARRHLRTWPGGVAAGALAVVVVTCLVALFDDWVPELSLGVLYVFAVLPIAAVWGSAVGALVAVASMLAFNFFFLPPVYTFTLADGRNWLALAVYLTTAVVVGALASRARRQTAEALQRERESALLADLASGLLHGTALSDELARIERRTAEVLNVSSVRVALGESAPGAELPLPLEANGQEIGVLYAPEREEPALDVRRRILPALASLLAATRERERLTAEALDAEALRRSDALKTAIIRAVSHDLRTPLATMEAALSGLGDRRVALDDADREELLETIRAEHSRLKRLVENLLDLSRIQADAARPSPEVWSADTLVGRALDGLEGAERVVVTMPDDVPAVRVDALQVQRALANLLENALKFSPAEATVEVTVHVTRRDVVLRVADRGAGIPEDERERIFEPFHRLPGPEGRTVGAGLGLAIARGFAQVNGGRVWVESRPERGATFALALPLAVVPVAVGATGAA